MAAWPEFNLACKVAINKRADFHERRMNNDTATGPMVQSSRFSLVNCNLKGEPSDWSEKSETTTTLNKGDGWDAVFAQIANQTRTI